MVVILSRRGIESPCRPAEHTVPVVRLPHHSALVQFAVAPDVPVPFWIVPAAPRCNEPWVLIA